MARPRSIFAGDTDYTGVDLSHIVAHIEQWRDALTTDVEILANVRSRLQVHGDSPGARDGLSHIDHFRDLFTRYRGDFARLAQELPLGVRDRHVAIASQLYQSLVIEDRVCVLFKQRHYLDVLSDSDQVQNMLAEVYRLCRDAIIDLGDIGSIVPRLQTYVDLPSATAPMESSSALAAFELKPNLFGVGLNLNYVLDRWGNALKRLALWRKRR